jgi:5-methylcytosine-specific restriction endonuclease McrA
MTFNSKKYKALWAKQNPEKMKASQKKYNKTQKAKERWRRYGEKHREERNAYSREYHKNHRKHYNEVHRKWVGKNKDKARHIDRKQHARRKQAIGSHTLEEWNEIKKAQNYRCAKCGKKKKLTIDHIIPLSKGGTHYRDNIQALCKSCNCKKSNKMLEN